MSWVPSPSALTMAPASFREVGPPQHYPPHLLASPGGASLAPSPAAGTVAAIAAAASSPVADRFAFNGPRAVASRQGSYTPQPVVSSPPAQALSPNSGHAVLNMTSIFSPSARRLRGASPVPPEHPRRSYTPLPVMQPLTGSPNGGVDDQLSHSLTNLVVPAGIASSGGVMGSPGPVRSLDSSYPRHQDWSAAVRAAQQQEGQARRKGPRPSTVSPQPTARATLEPVAHTQDHLRHYGVPSERAPPEPSQLGVADELTAEPHVTSEPFTHRPRMPSLTQEPAAAATAPSPAPETPQQRLEERWRPEERLEPEQPPVPVTLNVYWQRSVAFDSQGRVVRRMGDELTWGMQLVKDILGVYHVGVEVHGDEYTFGTYHAPSSKQIGDERSGVCRHDPQRPGPQFVFKRGHSMGTTVKRRSEVEDICAELGRVSYGRASYNRIHNNCVDFTRALCERLVSADIPLWCYRGAATAKLLGLGGEPPTKAANQLEDPFMHKLEDDNFDRILEPIPVEVHVVSTPTAMSLRANLPVIDTAGVSKQLAESVTGSPTNGTAMSAFPSMAAAPAMAAVEQLNPVASNGLMVGRLVSVYHNMGYSRGQIVSQDQDGKFTIAYADRVTEAGVVASRIIPLPEVPRETTALAQAFYLDEGSPFHAATSPACRLNFAEQKADQPQLHQPQPVPSHTGATTGYACSAPAVGAMGPSPQQPQQPAPLQPASLQPASLQPASLQPASLQPTPLQPASLQPASLQPTPLQPAQLQPAPLQPQLQPPPMPQSSSQPEVMPTGHQASPHSQPFPALLPHRIPAGVATAAAAPFRYTLAAGVAPAVLPRHARPLGPCIGYQPKDLGATWRW